MELAELKSEILANRTPTFLIFDVRNYGLAKDYLNRIADMLGKPHHFYNTASEALKSITSIVKEDCIRVVFNDEKITEENIEALQKYNDHIILWFEDCTPEHVDMKQAVVFEKLDQYQLLAYVQNELRKNDIITSSTIKSAQVINTDLLLKFIDCCDCNYAYVKNELDKMISLCEGSTVANSSCAIEYMNRQGFSDYRTAQVEDVVMELLTTGKVNYELFSTIEPMKFITVLYTIVVNQIKQGKATANNIKLMKKSYAACKSIVEDVLSAETAAKLLLINNTNFNFN